MIGDLPKAVDAERMLVGGLVTDPRWIPWIAEIVQPVDLWVPQLSALYELLLGRSARGEVIDLVTLPLQCASDPARFGPTAEILALADAVPSTVNLEHYARTIAEVARRRRHLQRLQAGIERAHQLVPVDELEAEIVREITTQRTAGGDGWVVAERVFDDALTRLNRISAGEIEPGGMRIGVARFDDECGGLYPQEVTILAGRPSMGKTALAMAIAERVAQHEGWVGVFSLEMPRSQLALRRISARARVSGTALRAGRISEEEEERVAQAVALLRRLRWEVDDQAGLTIEQIGIRARRLYAQHPDLRLIVVDYLQLVGPSDPRASREQQVSWISGQLKRMAKDLNVAVLALAQLKRDVEQRRDKRPILSDLRECIAADQDVYDARTGAWTPVGRLVPGCTVVGLGATWRAETAVLHDVWSTGARDVVKIRTRTGREIRVTPNHPLRVLGGWVEAGSLRPGTRIASARWLPEPTDARDVFTSDEARLLGYLISDGSYLRHRSASYTKADPVLVQDVREIVGRRFGMAARGENRGGTTVDLDLTVPGAVTGGNPLLNWLRDIGVHGQRGEQKRVPAGMWGCTNRRIAEFLGSLWAGDGSIVPRRRGGTTLKFTSTSRGLLVDVQRLLLRFGVVATLGRPERNTKSTMDIATLSVGEADAILAFADAISVPGEKGEKMTRAARLAQTCGRNAHIDRLPLELNDAIIARKVTRGLSWRELGYRVQGKAIGRADLERVAGVLDDAALADLARSDVLWDEIVEVTADGTAETYDMRVPAVGSMTVQGVFAHNSGAIEQDADRVLFIHRPEVYEPGDPKLAGVAELLCAKSRNGPTVDCSLHWDGQWTHFEDRSYQK